jgi:hypothetical protein
MIVTGGSDYHGFKASALHAEGSGKLGSLQLPYGMAVRLRRAHLARYAMALLLPQWPRAAAAALRRAMQTHYQLTGVELPPGRPLPADLFGVFPAWQSRVLDLPSAEPQLREAIVAAGRAQGVCLVEVPWEMAIAAECGGVPRLPEVTELRFGQTPIERLTHELVHQAILLPLAM